MSVTLDVYINNYFSNIIDFETKIENKHLKINIKKQDKDINQCWNQFEPIYLISSEIEFDCWPTFLYSYGFKWSMFIYNKDFRKEFRQKIFNVAYIFNPINPEAIYIPEWLINQDQIITYGESVSHFESVKEYIRQASEMYQKKSFNKPSPDFNELDLSDLPINQIDAEKRLFQDYYYLDHFEDFIN